MQASAQTCVRSAADSMIQNIVKSIYFNHPSQGNWTNYYIMLGPRDKAAPPTSQQIGQFPLKWGKYWHCHPFLFLFLPHPQESSLCSQPIRGNVRRTGRIFPEHVEQSFLDPEYSYITVWWTPQTISVKQKLAQLRTNCVRRTLFKFDE